MSNEMYKTMWRIMRQHNLSIIDDIRSDCKCTICKQILIEACNAPCGCRFCVDCIKTYLKDESKMCPGQSDDCRIQLINNEIDIQFDRPINRQISKLKTKCPNIGCQSEIELKSIADHLRTCDNQPQPCPYSALGCEEHELLVDKVREHLLREIVSHTRLMMNWIGNYRNENESLKKEVERSRAGNEEYIENTEKMIRNLERKERENNAQIKLLSDKICAMNNSNKTMEEQLHSTKYQHEKLISQLNDQRNEIDNLKERNQTIESRFDEISLEAEKTRSADKANYQKTIDRMNLREFIHDIKCCVIDYPYAVLHIKDLHRNVDENILYETFRTHGNFSSIQVYRDPETDESLTFAEITYADIHDAEGAMNNVNGEFIHGRQCRIVLLQVDPKRSELGSILIKNLHPTITTKEIKDTFVNFGEIVTGKVPADRNGVSKGFAFVTYYHEKDARKAVEAINGKIIRDKIVSVEMLVPGTQRNTREEFFTNCFVKYSGNLLTDETMKEVFQSCGDIVFAKLMVNEEGCSMGFGFVLFKKHESALNAVKLVNGRMIGDQIIYVGPHMKYRGSEHFSDIQNEILLEDRMQQKQIGGTLFITNLSIDIDDARLKTEFEKIGKVASTRVNKKNSISRGFGFVSFSNPDEATWAVTEMNGKIVNRNPLYVALLQKKKGGVDNLCSQSLEGIHGLQHECFRSQIMNPNAQRPFMARLRNIIQNRWLTYYPHMTPRNNIVGMPANQNLTMTGLPQQSQRRNILVDPMRNRNRYTHPISGNVQMNQARPQYKMVANERSASMYQYPMQDNHQMMNPDKIDLSTASKDANVDSMEAKQLLGEKIYPLVSKIVGDLAGKITGMFLELDEAELLYMIENENALRMKIDEALKVLNADKGGDGEAARHE